LIATMPSPLQSPAHRTAVGITVGVSDGGVLLGSAVAEALWVGLGSAVAVWLAVRVGLGVSVGAAVAVELAVRVALAVALAV
jgi:hypothetical protein